MRLRSAVLCVIACCAMMSPLPARTVLVPGPKPGAIEPGRVPFAFAQPPTVRTSFARDEPFLEGELSYGYTGRLVTPLQRGSDIIAPAGSPAYGVPMRVRDRDSLAQMPDGYHFDARKWEQEAGPPELAWCVVTRKEGSGKVGSVCLFDEGLGDGGYGNLMTTATYVGDRDPYGGGEVAPAPFDLGGPLKVRYFVQNLGKIARVKGQIWLGDTLVNQWGYQFGDIGRGSQPTERLFSVAGGVVGISPDPQAKDRYVLRVVEPLQPGGSAPLVEKRNDSRVTDR